MIGLQVMMIKLFTVWLVYYNQSGGKSNEKGSRSLINLTKSVAKICDLNALAEKFCSDHSDVIGRLRIDKIIVNTRTNDVKWLNGKQFSVHSN